MECPVCKKNITWEDGNKPFRSKHVRCFKMMTIEQVNQYTSEIEKEKSEAKKAP